MVIHIQQIHGHLVNLHNLKPMKKDVIFIQRKAFQVKAEDVKHLQDNKKLIDKIPFNAGEKDKLEDLDKSLDYINGEIKNSDK